MKLILSLFKKSLTGQATILYQEYDRQDAKTMLSKGAQQIPNIRDHPAWISCHFPTD
jgi:hypothetical protein